MGIIDNVRKAFTSDWDDSKIRCSKGTCTRSESDGDIAWICVSCLDAYCTEHVGTLHLYVPDLAQVSGYKVGDFAVGGTRSEAKKANEERKKLIQRQLQEWADEMNREGYDPYGWGPMTEFSSSGVKKESGYVLCKSCKKGVKKLGLHKKIRSAKESDYVDYNWGEATMSDEFRDRLSQKY